ncbi:MAG: 2-oxoacid:acceptor oxidoreductase subunit alpha [Phycisphaerales bacterium]|nr:2-oxoacid:acceptor oxidoreductase subunit alpha [Phycisphaerales bacterium]
MKNPDTLEEAPAIDDSRIRLVDRVAIRFAGDSGDGMQLAGTQFTNTSAIFGNDVSTLPDFPAEIRAPAGTLAGVSGFQIQISSDDIFTPGDRIDALIAMNPAALKANLADLAGGGILIVNSDEFTPANLKRAGYAENPLESDLLADYRVHQIPITTHTVEAVKEAGLGSKESARCRNFYALGLVFWLYDRPLETTQNWIRRKFGKREDIARANELALHAGYNFGETAEMFALRYRVEPAKLPPGRYRNLTGNQALAIGLVAATRLAKKTLFYGSYPITPASDILHVLAGYKHFDVRTFQAEDEIAAVCSTIGAAYAGAIGVTASSGPGIALKQEAIGLAVMTELPIIVIDVQRGGPSTGLPTKTEQADLWQAIVGRNGECPVAVIAPMSPADCFEAAIEAVRIATRFMLPVMILSDGYIANSAEPWRVVKAADLAPIEIRHATNGGDFKPYQRDDHGSRPWAIPGTPGLEHRVGGLEKAAITGNVSYDPDNHQRMINQRADKIDRIAHEVPPQAVFGDTTGDLLIVTWGGTYGAARTATQRLQAQGASVSHAHLRWMNPFPANLGEVLGSFKHVLVCELNMGQLQTLIRGRYALDAEGLHKVKGRPFMVSEIVDAAERVLKAPSKSTGTHKSNGGVA